MPRKPIESESEYLKRVLAERRADLRRSRALRNPEFMVEGVASSKLAPRVRRENTAIGRLLDFFEVRPGVEYDLSGTSTEDYEKAFLKALREERARYRRKE